MSDPHPRSQAASNATLVRGASAPLRAISPPARTARFRRGTRQFPQELIWLLLLLPSVGLCGASWTVGGDPDLTSVGFLVLTVASAGIMLRQFLLLPRTARIGPMVLFGGVLLWFCQDYLANWMGHDFRRDPVYDAELIARVATCHCCFVLAMVVGLAIRRGKTLERALAACPEPPRPDHYLLLILVSFGLGLVPYVFFSQDSLFVTFARAMTGFYGGGADFTFSRTGNLNYDWGGYLFELIKVGRFGGLLAAFYALLVARTTLQKGLAWGIWGFWLLLAFGSGTRGQLVFMSMPVLVFLLLKHAKAAARVAGRLSSSAVYQAIALALLVFAMMQAQSQLRTRGVQSTDQLVTVELTELQGNHMFSEGLSGWSRIPSQLAPFHDTPPGTGALLAIPDTLYRIAIHPIPRALWTTKPIDPVWAWHNELVAGTTGTGGTTISTGIVGWWYFRFGFLGMLQGGVFMGWLLAVGDRALARARATDRPMAILVSLSFLAWVFRCFRDLAIGELYEVVIATLALALIVKAMGTSR